MVILGVTPKILELVRVWGWQGRGGVLEGSCQGHGDVKRMRVTTLAYEHHLFFDLLDSSLGSCQKPDQPSTTLALSENFEYV